MQQIYLDYNATTPVAAEVAEAMLPYISEHFGNASSTHSLGVACSEAIQLARERVATLIGATPEEIIFTGNGTESNNIAIKGLMMSEKAISEGRFDRHLIVSNFEHPAVDEPARYLQRMGFGVSFAEVNQDGILDPQTVAELLQPGTALVSIMHANNEIGTIQPIQEIAKLCHEKGIPLHTDASQSVGKVPTQVDSLDVDLLTIAGHKLYAPKGIGALYVRGGIELNPPIHGAGHEFGIRPGTENTAYIVGLGVAAKLAFESLSENLKRMEALRDNLQKRLSESIAGLTINGEKADRLPNTLSVNFPNVVGHELLSQVPELFASTGSACHSGSTLISATLKAIGVDPKVAQGTVRLSLGRDTTLEDIDRASSLLVDAWEKFSE